MAFPGTPVLSVENPVRITASISFVDMSAAPVNTQGPAWDLATGSSFFVTCQPPMIGLTQQERLGAFPLNYWTVYAYGVNGGNYALYKSDEYLEDTSVLNSSQVLITDDQYFFVIDRGGLTYFGGFPTPTGGIGLCSMPVSDFTDDTTHVYDAQLPSLEEIRSGPYTIATFPANGNPNFGIRRWPGSSPSTPIAAVECLCTRTDIITPTPTSWIAVLQVFPDRSNLLWNGYRLGDSVGVDWLFSEAVDDTYLYKWLELRDDLGVDPSIACLMRYQPLTYTLDAVGPYDQSFYQISFDIPALQAAIDAFDTSTGYPNVLITGSERGYFVAFLDGLAWKYILVALDGSTYQYVDLVGADPDATAMIATFEAGTYSVSGSFNAVSNFAIFEDNLYLTAAPFTSTDYCFGPLSVSAFKRRPNVIVN